MIALGQRILNKCRPSEKDLRFSHSPSHMMPRLMMGNSGKDNHLFILRVIHLLISLKLSAV